MQPYEPGNCQRDYEYLEWLEEEYKKTHPDIYWKCDSNLESELSAVGDLNCQ